MGFEFKDIYSISDPDGYVCSIGNLATNDVQSYLHIRIHPKGNRSEFFIISFDAVRYYSGPLRWIGANFSLAPYEECLTILLKLPGYEDFLKVTSKINFDQLPATLRYNLYLTGSPGLEVKIIAKKAEVIQPDNT